LPVVSPNAPLRSTTAESNTLLQDLSGGTVRQRIDASPSTNIREFLERDLRWRGSPRAIIHDDVRSCSTDVMNDVKRSSLGTSRTAVHQSVGYYGGRIDRRLSGT
jgi:hypothetical protein